MEKQFIDAIHSLNKVRITFHSKEDVSTPTEI